MPFYLPKLITSDLYDLLLKQKLLDETTSRVICASPLLYGEGHGSTMMSSQSNSAVNTSSISSMMGGMVDEGVVIFITHQSALVVMTLEDYIDHCTLLIFLYSKLDLFLFLLLFSFCRNNVDIIFVGKS